MGDLRAFMMPNTDASTMKAAFDALMCLLASAIVFISSCFHRLFLFDLMMYLSHYGLAEPPFSITPDPRFVYLSDRHRDGLAHLLYGVGQGGGGGFVQLTGEVGTGKTTLCRLLLEQLPEDTHVALVLNPLQSPFELLQTICEELMVDVADVPSGSTKVLVDRLNHYLLDAYAANERVVLIIDEAQNLSTAALEQVRLLTNLETATQKLLQIILLGQPELRDMLARDDLRQLAQRITARHHLTPLSAPEVEGYLRHRLAVAGCQRLPFTRNALKKIHEHTDGIPRLINVLADRSLMAGYVHDAQLVSDAMVEEAAAEVLPSHSNQRLSLSRWIMLAAALGIVLLGVWLWRDQHPAESVTPSDAPAQTTQQAGNQNVDQTAADAEDHHVGAVHSSDGRGDLSPPIDGNTLRQKLRALQETDSDNTSAIRAWMAQHAWPLDDATVRTIQRCPPVFEGVHHCWRSRTTLDTLASIGQPVLVPLNSGRKQHLALLVGVDVDEVRLVLGDETVDVRRIEFNRLWPNRFQAIWSLPVAMQQEIDTLGVGSSGALVDWLVDQFNHVHDGSAAAERHGPAYFDQRVSEQVVRLQRQRGLVPDGLVGPETWLALAALSQPEPKLQSRLKR